MIQREKLQAWLETLKPGTSIGVTNDGLVLSCHEDPQIYIEVGDGSSMVEEPMTQAEFAETGLASMEREHASEIEEMMDWDEADRQAFWAEKNHRPKPSEY